MTLYTDGDAYLHVCTNTYIISWCYTKNKDYLECSYKNCSFRLPALLIAGRPAYEDEYVMNLSGSKSFIPLLDFLDKIEL